MVDREEFEGMSAVQGGRRGWSPTTKLILFAILGFIALLPATLGLYADILLLKWGTHESRDELVQYSGSVTRDAVDHVYASEYRRQLQYPINVAVDGAGNFYAVDAANSQVQKFDHRGQLLAKWGSSGTRDGQFQGPLWVAVDPTGHVYVADQGNRRIQKFDGSGQLLGKCDSF